MIGYLASYRTSRVLIACSPLGRDSRENDAIDLCRTAAAVLSTQARRRLTAPGLPRAQGP